MNEGPWACVRCGTLIREKQPPRGLAHQPDPRPYCAGCLRLGVLTPSPTQPVLSVEPRRRRPA